MTSMVAKGYARLPSSGPERETLREKGQFWTPGWVAEAMVGYVALGNPRRIFDPAVGGGAFFQAAKKVAQENGISFDLAGCELDPDALEDSLLNGLSPEDLTNVAINDFILNPPSGPFDAIVANPPYIRHHRLSAEVKRQLKRISYSAMGTTLDGRAGLHIYFLIRALRLLGKGGRLAFILPADTCEGVFAPTLWNWIAHNYRIDAVVAFAPDASPFPRVDTNPLIFMITNEQHRGDFLWAKCLRSATGDLKAWITSGFSKPTSDHLEIHSRNLEEGLSTGFSRPPMNRDSSALTLGDFASAMRGIVTGDNDFFFLTTDQAKELRIPDDFLITAIGRTRDAPGDEITRETISDIERRGRPTLLFSPGGEPIDSFPQAVQDYLMEGESKGIHRKPLISTRHPWYKMETRIPPPILFTYLGRRNSRFILNTAGVVPLTCLLCVYPHTDAPDFTRQIWSVLKQPETVSNLALVGKSYGSGAIKVEPRALERLPLPNYSTTSDWLAINSPKIQTEFWPELNLPQPYLHD